SIMYMLETNPGPGLGVLIAYALFAKDQTTKDSAPGAIIIHLFGGIHEIYFPYILMNPVVIIAPIIGNMCAIFYFNIMDLGLVGPPSPGSIIAFLMMSGSSIIPNLIGVIIATVVSFVIAMPIVKMSDVKSLDAAQDEMAAMKAEAKGQAPAAVGEVKAAGDVKKVVFACDAGMGSSAMGATKFRNRIKKERPDLTVINTSVDNIPADCDVAVVQVTLVDRAAKSAPQAQMVTIGNFLADPNLDALYKQLTSEPAAAAPAPAQEEAPAAPKKAVMDKNGIKLGLKSVSKEEAIRAAGELLVEQGCVEPAYVDAMLDREKLVTTYMGMGLAIPHGTTQAKGTVKKTGIVFTQYPDGVDFGDEKAQLVIGIAGIGDEHLDLLSKIADTLDDEEVLEKMKTTTDVDWILKTLS
ncbi:MAG TPA: PTS mannitol transporter subunit IICBA, partial [Lachnospiraceae bacterium]|nr:PTS mannitol transporter subunit IICBA [Lachnospiraceae bacterium]